jgi:hypothetical protein
MLLRNTFRAFRHRDYFIFWCGLFLGHTGTLVQATTQSWLIFQLTNSPFYLGLEGLCLAFRGLSFRLWAERSSTEPIAKSSRRHPDSLSLDGVVSRRDGLPWNDSRLACAKHFGADRLFCFLRTTRAPVDPAPAGTPVGATKRCHPLSNGLQWIDALRTVDRRSADSLYRYQRLLFRRDNWKRNRASYDLYDSHRRNSTTDKQNHRVARYGRGVGFGMEHPGSFIPFHCPRNRHFLHQAVHSIQCFSDRPDLQNNSVLFLYGPKNRF